jgi:predicted dehydrogenase
MQQLSRRAFIGTSLAAAAAAGLPGSSPAQQPAPASADKLNLAGIGIGGMGKGDLENVAAENIVALCDVDHAYAAGTIKQYPNARLYKDYRELLEKEKDLHGVLIATPDHTHAVIAAAAMRAGKHVYCQKPLAHDIREVRALARIAKETGVVTQMGIQGHSMEGIRRIREWFEAGLIGEVREVDGWCSLSYYPHGHTWWSTPVARTPKEQPAVPAELPWDLWLGPAPARPYHPAYHPKVWRAWWDFGVGMMGDRGAHTLDPLVWTLQLGLPTAIEATSTGLNPDTHPVSSMIIFQFPERGSLPPLKLTWYEGFRPPLPSEVKDENELPDKEGGLLIKGTKGSIVCGVYGNGARLLPRELMLAHKDHPKTLPRVAGGHYQDWLRACKDRSLQTGAHFEYAAHLTEICLLGNLAKRVNGRIEWDGAAMKVTNNEAANAFVAPAYREGWTL